VKTVSSSDDRVSAVGADPGRKSQVVPPPLIPLAFVALALSTLGATLAWASAGSPQPLALLHALAVGVFLTVAMGLLYQFVPVVAMAPLRLRYLCFVHLALAAAGTACLVDGFQRFDFPLVRLGGALHLCGVLLEGLVLATTLWGGRPPAPVAGAALSLGWLVATIALGMWTAGRLLQGSDVLGIARFHALAGLAGFFGTIITAVTLRLLRMFERVDVESRTPLFALGVTLAAIVALVAGRFGGGALLIASVAVALNVVTIARARNPAYQRETLLYACVSAAGAVAAAAAYVAGAPAAAIACAVWFYVGTAVIGYLQRIVPFIWWIRRSRREGTKNIPTLGEMNETRIGYAILGLWIVAGGSWLVHPDARWPAIVALVAWTALVAQLARPFCLKARVKAGVAS
jgi:hypothetical protein